MVAFCGYVYGSFPPARVCHFHEAGTLLLNLFKAHCAVYDAIKALPGAWTETGTLSLASKWLCACS